MTFEPYDHANPIFVRSLLALEKENAEVLDIGCWNGALGRQVKSQKAFMFDGVELDSTQAERAGESGYQQVYCLDLDRKNLSEVISRRYDIVLFGDVLEHLKDPAKILRESVSLLKPDGKVFLSLPNIGFLTCRLNLLLGRWNYANYGIMDRTHLRFFTKKTMIELATSAGLIIESSQSYVGLINYPWIIREPLRALAWLWPSLFAIQIVIIASPKR